MQSHQDDTSVDASPPGAAKGLFDLRNSENPGTLSLEPTNPRQRLVFPPATSHSPSAESEAQIFATRGVEAIKRLRHVLELFKSGALHEETSRLGVAAGWLERHHATPPGIFICEHANPISTLFAVLGTYGSPRALRNTLKIQATVCKVLRESDLPNAQFGLMYSPDHEVVCSGPAATTYLTLPERGSGVVKPVNLLSKKEQRLYAGSSYRDLSLAPQRLEEIRDRARLLLQEAETKTRTTARALQKQSDFNHRSREQGRPLEPSMDLREVQLTFDTKCAEERVRANLHFCNDLEDTIKTSNLNGEGRIPYLPFSAAISERLISRIVPASSFTFVPSHAINALFSGGVENIPTFVSAFYESGILLPDEPLGRLYSFSADKVRYMKLFVDYISSDDVALKDDHGNRFSARALMEQSAESLANTGRPTFIPAAAIRYWGNFAISNFIACDDGMPYELHQRLDRAMRHGFLGNSPRSLTIMPYTTLWQYTPADLSSPYRGLISNHYSVLDYYEYALNHGDTEKLVEHALGATDSRRP